MTPIGASAPGKALLCGEYAVLEGAPATVAAVNRRVTAIWSESPRPMAPEVAATLRVAEAELGAVARSLAIDVRELQRDGIKLGLGSSAAAAAATAGAVFASHGRHLEEPRTLRRIFDCALEGHGAIAPHGSGVDIAASTFGGFLRYTRNGSVLDPRPIACPPDLVIRLVWTGHAARTSELVGKVRALRRADPRGHHACLHRLSELAVGFAVAFEGGDAAGVVEHAASYAEAMRALGIAADAPIVDSRLERAQQLAHRFSGSAKPCGAGGGDVAIAFFVDQEAATRFEVACKEAGLHPIDVSWGATGVRAC